MPDSFTILGPDGPFNKIFEWFSVRDCQREMAEAIDSAIEQNENLIVESGTGTGKTFSYLVPPLLAKKKTVISTRTKNLQEQLFQTDIPWVCKALGISPEVRVLKGRSNYLCLFRHDQLNRQPDMLGATARINRIYDWVSERDDGDISEYPRLSSEHKKMITSTAENCLGSQCEFSKECYVNRARIKARSADVLVVNHNLLCLNFQHSGEDESGLLSDAEVIVVDEGHRFPEIAAQTMGISISKERLLQFCRNLQQAALDSELDQVWLDQKCAEMAQLTEDARTKVSDDSVKVLVSHLTDNREFMTTYWKIVHLLEEFVCDIEPIMETSRELELCRDHALEIIEDAKCIFERENEDCATWYESSRSGFSLSQIPLEPGNHYGPLITDFSGSWIFTSATLSVGEDFSHFQSRIGLEGVVSERWESPFNFKKQALVYFPRDMPQPKYRDLYDESVAEVVKQVMPLSSGRAFVLFTSHYSMNYVYKLLDGKLNFTLLCQGHDTSSNLLERFKDDGNAVLLGTSSFWEGVDVKGEALSCVIIAKLPFIPPNDPLLIAREVLMNKVGKNIFSDWQVPSAVLSMKQGTGRLIRDSSDKGVLILCDPRIKTSGYGKKFLDSLPPMKKTDQLEDVRNFFAQ